MFIASVSFSSSGSISTAPTPKIVACIRSNSNPIPQNHKSPSCISCTKTSYPTFKSAFSEHTAPQKE